MVGINKKSCMPQTANVDVKDKHYELFRCQGGKGAKEERGHGGGAREHFCVYVDASLGAWARFASCVAH